MSLFRTALQASEERIARLDEGGLNGVMRELLKAQAYVARANVGEVIVNTQPRAGDDGADGMSPAPPAPDAWLGAVATCWQFKSGRAGEPAELAGEVIKPIPKRTLENGGRYVVVCSASTRGDLGEKARLEKLQEEARNAGIPADRIEVIGSERLTTWCNQHPAIAATLAGRPPALWTLSEWTRSDEHDVEWQPTQVQKDAIAKIRDDFDLTSGTSLHVHICGHPGVGKSRFALELCREANWSRFVVYVHQAADLRLGEMLASCVTDPGVKLVMVADEVVLEQLLSLRATVGNGNGRVRLITIGTSISPEPSRIQPVEVRPLPEPEVTKVVQRWYRGMPIEHAEFVANFSAGYMRLARLAAAVVHRNPTMDVRTMLEQQDIKAFLDAMLGTGDRGSLHVVAVLGSIGWTEDSEGEGKLVAEHLGLNWTQVRREVDRFHERFQIVPRGGRLRYISPRPLAIYLALEAWRIYTPEMKALPGLLSEAGIDAYYERLEDLASSPQAGDFGREQLDSFFPVADLNDARLIRRWSALAPANPGVAAARMRAELERRTPGERSAIRDSSLRWLISTLVRLAWSSITFDDAVRALAMLAEVEKAKYSSGASAEFVHRFRLFLGGTAVPYRDRISILDELLAGESLPLKRLAIRSLAQVGDRHGFRMHRTPITRGLPEEEWQPETRDEYVNSFLLGVERLIRCVAANDASLAEILGEVVPDFARFLAEDQPIRGAVINLFRSTAQVFPQHREELRMRASGRLNQAKKFKKDLSAEAVTDIEALVASLRDDTPSGRLRELVGPGGQDDRDGLDRIARECAEDPELLRSAWTWLTNGEPRKVWSFGTALGQFNIDQVIADLIRSAAMGGDGRVACAYLERRAASEGPGWLDNWLEDFTATALDRGDFILEATWRLTPTTVGARRVERILAGGNVRAESVGQLAYGGWDEKLDMDSLAIVITALARHEDGVRAASTMLHTRLEKRPEEFERWETIAVELATNERLIADRQEDGHEWAELAKRLVDRHPMELFEAILRLQNVRDDGASWFLAHSLATDIAFDCVEREPTAAWEILRGFLEQDYAGAYPFLVGFPEGLIDRLDHNAILAWVAENPRYRVPLLAQVVLTGFADDSLAAALVDAYGTVDEVSSAFRARLTSGSWNGPISKHWADNARFMREIATRSKRAALRRWAADVADEFERMAERDRAREEEEELRSR